MSSPRAPQEEVIQPDAALQNVTDDEAYDNESERSSLTSLTSSILHGKVEGGRTYAVYGKEGKSPREICFSGSNKFQRIWSIEMAEEFPSAEVIGTDVAPTQPDWVPPNCHFEVDDVEREWTWKEDSFDFVYARDLLLAIRDWPALIDQTYTHLRGGGWVEFQAIVGVLGCDDDSIPEDSYLRKFSTMMEQGSAKFGASLTDPMRWKGWLEERGYQNVTERVFKLPFNPWPKDPRMKLLGAWEMENLLSGLEAMVTRMFQKGLGWTDAEVTVFLAFLRKEIKNPRMHGYWPYYVVYAQKPKED
ncbi:phosphoethanolamine n-methyltransferase 3 [Fusarium subglutinans]|uniref:Phosphoethanolamine n-methyltransferase 3 n=1 Tax=Gibberella subglutinans TaxID=42677 RepID=A0A8H5PE61_GIBSU|nr:phosphoethanolamine n-methyltransferase 3 [Fusarium subglutinans]KAF5595166.1 phosphoethanolamine n-methyltransferase 3 [Fusarium subglutinans]